MRSRLFARSAAVAIAFDMDSSSVVQKRIQQGGRHGGVTSEETGRAFKGDVGGDDKLDGYRGYYRFERPGHYPIRLERSCPFG